MVNDYNRAEWARKSFDQIINQESELNIINNFPDKDYNSYNSMQHQSGSINKTLLIILIAVALILGILGGYFLARYR
jgi:hypothetical protein